MSGVGLGAGCWTFGIQGMLEGSFVGIVDASQTVLSVDDGSRTLTIAPVGASFSYYAGGVKFVVTSPQSISWPNTDGSYFFYFNELGQLTYTTAFVSEILTKYCFVSIVTWDQAAGAHIYFANERHGIQMGTYTHLYLHNTQGAKFDQGLGLNNFSVDGTGNVAANAQFTSLSGIIWDEDLKILVPAQSQFPIFYKSGTQWKRKSADLYPVIYSGTAGYAGTRLPYNLNTGGVWSLAEVDANKFVLVHVFATNDMDYPVIGLQGQAQYISKTAARDGAAVELNSLTGLPFAEFVPIGTVIFETTAAYLNVPHARIVSIDGSNYADKRAIYFRPGKT